MILIYRNICYFCYIQVLLDIHLKPLVNLLYFLRMYYALMCYSFMKLVHYKNSIIYYKHIEHIFCIVSCHLLVYNVNYNPVFNT